MGSLVSQDTFCKWRHIDPKLKIYLRVYSKFQELYCFQKVNKNLEEKNVIQTLLETSVSKSVSLDVMASSSAFCFFTVCFATRKKKNIHNTSQFFLTVNNLTLLFVRLPRQSADTDLHCLTGRHSALIINAMNSRFSGPCFEHWPGSLYCASLHQGI